MDTQVTAFIRIEYYPLGKNLIADIAEINIKKISKKLAVESCTIKFLPPNSYFNPKSQEKTKIRWRCLELENSLNLLRNELTGVALLICYDNLTKLFLKETLHWPIENIIPSSLPSDCDTAASSSTTTTLQVNKKVMFDLSSQCTNIDE